MVNAVTEEFWKMVQEAIDDQVLHFKSEDSYMFCVGWRSPTAPEQQMNMFFT